ncbi:MAG: hypothetical protein ACD_40C00174G0004 [uncultured bacterium]|nr:MAG: hypothetical protein ACD_40C00174G0004 [uncultured bacterium]
MNKLISQHQAKIVDTAKKLDIIYLALFGSYARGEETKNSDVDLLVEFDGSKRKSLFDLMEAEEQLGRLLGRKVDLVSRSGISRYIKPYIMDDIKVIYAQNT